LKYFSISVWLVTLKAVKITGMIYVAANFEVYPSLLISRFTISTI